MSENKTRLKRETQGAFCVLNAKSQTRKSMKINVICTVVAAMSDNTLSGSVWLTWMMLMLFSGVVVAASVTTVACRCSLVDGKTIMSLYQKHAIMIK